MLMEIDSEIFTQLTCSLWECLPLSIHVLYKAPYSTIVSRQLYTLTPEDYIHIGIQMAEK